MKPSILDWVSVIVPVGEGDESWRALHEQAKSLFPQTETIFAFAKLPSNLPTKIYALQCPHGGRARQMNFAAKHSEKEFLWFLHADTLLGEQTIGSLIKSLGEHPNSLLYSNLRFQDDGPRFMWLNSIGLWWRSHLLGIPFGDQGLAISRKLFLELGGYNEEARYGEDHLLVWAAKIKGIPIRCTGGSLTTSSRKYNGHWGRVTLSHIAKTYQQAAPEFAKWLRRERGSK